MANDGVNMSDIIDEEQTSPEDNDTIEPDPLTALDGRVWVALTHKPLDVLGTIARVKDPGAGAVVMFAGTTRDTFASTPVLTLRYTAYVPLALQSLKSIATSLLTEFSGTVKLAIVHRLGECPVGEESILICVSGVHRKEAWRAGEEALERVKERVEVWKEEVFEGGGVWRSNRDGQRGHMVSDDGAKV